MGAIKSNIPISFGPLFNIHVNVLSAVDDGAKETSFNTLCIGADDQHRHAPARCRQDLACEECKNSDSETFVKGRDLGDGTFAIASQADITAAATVGDDITKQMIVTCHEADEVASSTLHGAKTYFLEPGKTPLAQQGYALVRTKIQRMADEGKVYCTVFATRSKPAWYRFNTYGQAVTIEMLAWPAQVRSEPNVPDADVDEALLDQLDTLVPVVPFDAANYQDTRKEALEAVIAAASAEPGAIPAGATAKAAKAAAPSMDLSSLLGQAVAAASATAKPKAAKKTAAKKTATPARKAS